MAKRSTRRKILYRFSKLRETAKDQIGRLDQIVALSDCRPPQIKHWRDTLAGLLVMQIKLYARMEALYRGKPGEPIPDPEDLLEELQGDRS